MLVTIAIIILSLLLARSYANLEKQREINSKKLEAQFIIGSLYLLQYKYHMLQMLQIIYDKAAESDPKYIEDYEKIIKAVDEKTDKYGEEWFTDLQKTLEHETKYKNWQEVTKYFKETLKNAQSKENNTWYI